MVFMDKECSRGDMMLAVKIKRGIVGSYNLILFLFQRLKQIISKHADDNKIDTAIGRFELKNFIGSIDSVPLPNKEFDGRKIKVCILLEASNFWGALETICKAFEQDSKYEVCILIPEKNYGEAKPFLEKNFFHNRYYLEEEYDIEKEHPNILLFSYYGPGSSSSPTRVRQCMKHRFRFQLVIAIVGELITYEPDDYVYDYLSRYRAYNPDYYIMDPFFFDFLVKRNQISRKIIALNNAKYDGIYEGMDKEVYPADVQWDKLRDRRTVLWVTTHGIGGSYVVTFDLYAKPLLDYAREHSNVGFVIRLHPSFVQEMRQNDFWTLGDLARFKEYCRQSPNIVWDESATYNRAYSVADGILTDGYSGMVVSALPLMKPICACYRFDVEVEQAHKDYVRHLYQAHSVKDMYDFFDMVAAGEDPMYEERKGVKEKYIKNFDGKNGQRIKDFIEKKYFEEACN